MDFEALKKQNLTDLCINRLGYKKHSGTCRSWAKLISPISGKSIVVCQKPSPKGYYRWFYQDGGEGGTLVDLLLKEHGMTLEGIAETYRGEFFSLKEENRTIKEEYMTERELKSHLEKSPSLNVAKASFFSFRGIPNRTLLLFRDLRGGSYPSFRTGETVYTASFRMFSYDAAVSSAVSSGVASVSQLEGEKSRTIFRCGRLGRGSVVLVPKTYDREKEVEMFVFESPIDSLSFAEIYRSLLLSANFIMVCTMGTPGCGTYDFLDFLFRERKIKNATLCLDNDSAGRSYLEKIALNLAEKEKIKYFNWEEPQLNHFKDFNEVLKSILDEKTKQNNE